MGENKIGKLPLPDQGPHRGPPDQNVPIIRARHSTVASQESET